jgi:hypothetical protein
MPIRTRRSNQVLLLVASLTIAACSAADIDDQSAPEVVDVEAQPVVLGTVESDEMFPWVVRVQGTLGCHGVLIEPRWVLTAAHCIVGSFNGVTVSYRRLSSQTGAATGQTQATGQSSVFVHPDYQPATGANDIGLVKLRAPLDPDFAPDPLLQPALLPAEGNYTGAAAVVASQIHHTATAPLPAGKVAVLRGTVWGESATLLYAKSPTASLCPGDSGSGFVTMSGGVNRVIGIASEGSNTTACDRANAEFTATKVSAYLPWIRSFTGAVQTPYRYIARSAPLMAPTGAGSPAGISYPALGVTNIVYRDGSGRLHELWQQGAQSGTSNLTALAGNPAAAAGDPTSFLSPDGYLVVPYRGTDGEIHSLYWNTGPVGHDALSRAAGAPRAASNPVGYVSPDGWHHVIYRRTDGHLEELYWIGQGAPGHGNLTAAAAAPAAVGDPAPYVNSRTNESIVAYRGTDNRIHTVYWTTGPVGHDNLSGFAGTPPAAGRPAAYYRANDDSHQVVYRATDGHIYELWWVGYAPVQGWNLTAAAGAPLAASDPAAYYSAATNTKHVVYRSSDGHLHDLAWTPGGGAPQVADMTREAMAPDAVDNPTAFTVEAQRTQHVAYRGRDGHLHEIRWQLPPVARVVRPRPVIVGGVFTTAR